jgi:hypothetical protein
MAASAETGRELLQDRVRSERDSIPRAARDSIPRAERRETIRIRRSRGTQAPGVHSSQACHQLANVQTWHALDLPCATHLPVRALAVSGW